jgi:hypothetical protein
LLKAVILDAQSGRPVSTLEVTRLRLDADLPNDLFTFTPPAGTVVQDARPRPAPTADEYRQQLTALAAQAGFPLFAPGQFPAGLVPRAPRLTPQPGGGATVELAYVPAQEAATDAPAPTNGIGVVEQRATYATVATWTEQAEPAALPGGASGRAWVRRGTRAVGGGGTDSAAIVLRDGTLVSASSFARSPVELLAVVASLEPVPGGHAPLPDPVAPTLAEIRKLASYPIYVPAAVPAGLVPEPPVGGERPDATVELTWHDATGAAALRLLTGPAGCCIDQDGRKTGEDVSLPSGLAAHFFANPPQSGGPLLWWHQDGAFVSLSGPQLSKDDLVRIAASVSKTAEIGSVQPRTARPTPTSLPSPAFKVLRPGWLPEQAEVREHVQDVPGQGTGVVLAFDPRPNDQPHDVLTLHEAPAPKEAPAQNGPVNDPQATRETIGGRDVTIIRRGDGCVTALWTQVGVALTLINPYDPPGLPGQVRYSCDQFKQIIESVR